MKSSPYKYGDKLYRFDFDTAQVEWLVEASAEEIAEDEAWRSTHKGAGLHHVGPDGFIVLDTVGLNSQNWTNKEARDEYLSSWSVELEEELRALVRQFEHEMKYLL